MFGPLRNGTVDDLVIVGQLGQSLDGRVATATGHSKYINCPAGIEHLHRLRSLVGTFSAANQTGFHRPDGEGYRLFVETVLDVEKRNPQMASRLATALRSWRSLEPVRQAKAREALLAMANTENLSADLRDIIERTLA